MNDIEKAIEDLKERVIFMEDFLKEKESMGTIVLDKEKILNSIALNKLSIIALEKQLNGGWIPVKKKLPDTNKDILVTLNDGKVVPARYLFADNLNHITAWQPLPLAYVEVENE